MERAIDDVFPGGVLYVDFKGKVLINKGFGFLFKDEKVTEDTIYDIASLTKPMATTTIIMKLHEEKKINLEDRVKDYIDESKNKWLGEIPICFLLSHSSGLGDWKPYGMRFLKEEKEKEGDYDFAKKKIIEWIINEEQKYKPFEKSLYSDIGFIILGFIIEKIEKKDLSSIFRNYVSRPLNLNDTFYIQCPDEFQKRIAPTGWSDLRKRFLRGEVQDDNAFILGGSSGHAGVFSSAKDIGKWARTLIECYKGQNAYLKKGTLKLFWSKKFSPPYSTWRLGFDTPTPMASSSGKYFSLNSYGHLGWTGCSFWIDIEKDLIVVLLTNRTQLHPDNQKIKKFRPILHDAIIEAFL